jgi:predicted DNA-binding transcriptional regulator YafY
MDEYVTKTGRVLTDADFEALADEAERGYDVSHLDPADQVVPPPVSLTLAEGAALLLAAEAEHERWDPALKTAPESAVAKLRASRTSACG